MFLDNNLVSAPERKIYVITVCYYDIIAFGFDRFIPSFNRFVCGFNRLILLAFWLLESSLLQAHSTTERLFVLYFDIILISFEKRYFLFDIILILFEIRYFLNQKNINCHKIHFP